MFIQETKKLDCFSLHQLISDCINRMGMSTNQYLQFVVAEGGYRGSDMSVQVLLN